MKQQEKAGSGAIIVMLLIVVVLYLTHGGQGASSPAPAIPLVNVSKALVRISQLNPAQYRSQEEFDQYAPSACSTTSLTEVLNGYGKHLRITDVLQAEIVAKAISPELGLLDEDGLDRTVRPFGFQTTLDHAHTLAQVIAIANKGTPVIVSIPPGRSSRFPGGHILVAMGGNEQTVFLVDSSSYNLDALPRPQFQTLWSGLTAIVTPTAANAGTAPDYRTLAEQDAQAEGLPPDIFHQQINHESGFQADIVSPAGAIGIAQLMPGTAKELGVDPHDPIASLKAAAHLMATYLKKYNGDYAKALAAYEAGPGAVDRAIRLGGVQWTKYLAASTCRYIHTILNEQVCS